MAAPSGTTWGSTVGSYGRIGFYIDVITNNATTYAFKVQIWFWSKYSVSDTANTLYFNNRDSSGSVTTSLGAKSISTTVASGSGWSTSNQKKLYTSGTYTYTRGTSTKTRYLYAKLTGVDRVGGTMTVSKSVSIPKLSSYAVSYNANGGTGAPSAQTKWYGKTLTLSSTKPTRTGYTFLRWNTNSSGTGTNYNSGASYTGNAAVTLYAVWQINTWPVTYNANGGKFSDGTTTKTVTKTYGVNMTVYGTTNANTPIRENYNFLGWVTSSNSSTVVYKPGASYTANSSTTLYAVWELAYTKPRITNISVDRCMVGDSGEVVNNDEGTSALVKFKWECDYDVTSISIEWKLSTNSSYGNEKSVSASTTNGSVETVIGDGLFDTDHTYDILITVADNTGHNNVTYTLPSTIFTIDMLGGGKGVAFGKAAEFKDVADFAFDIHARNQIVLENDKSMCGKNVDGTLIQLIYQSENNNTVIGYDNYVNASGRTHLYGHDIYHYVSNIASPTYYRPYRRRGDVLDLYIRTSGYITNSKKDVCFFVPFSEPILGSPTVTITSNSGFKILYEDTYLFGSSIEGYVISDSITTGRYMHHGINVTATFNNTETVIKNNVPVGVVASIKITLS